MNNWVTEAVDESMRTFSGTLQESRHSRSCCLSATSAVNQIIDTRKMTPKPSILNEKSIGGKRACAAKPQTNIRSLSAVNGFWPSHVRVNMGLVFSFRCVVFKPTPKYGDDYEPENCSL
jgi:hypothetical protein